MFVKVFGGAGFVGNHLVKKLLSEGHDVTVFDMKKPRVLGANVYDPTKGESSWYNHVKFIGGDVTDYKQVYYAINRGDFVVNLAAVALFAPAEQDPHITASVNVAGAVNVMKACIENKAAHLVYTSTGSVYSTLAKPPFDEAQPVEYSANSMYGMSKLFAETAIRHYADKQSLTVLRLPHVIGPGKTWGANTFIVKLLAGERPVIFGDGLNKNDFTYVEDVVQAIELALKKQTQGVYNIGSGASRTTHDFLNIARQCTDRMDITPSFAPARGVDFPVFEYDISKAKKELGYNPKFTLEQAIQKTCLEWKQWL